MLMLAAAVELSAVMLPAVELVVAPEMNLAVLDQVVWGI